MGEMAHPAMHLEYLVAGVSTTAGAPVLAKPVLSLVPPYRSPAWPIVFLALNRVCSNVPWSNPSLVRSRLSGTMIVLANSRTRYAGITCPQTGFHKGPPHATPPLGPLRIRIRNPDQSHLVLQHQNAAYRIVDTLHTNVPCVYRLVYARDHCGDITGCRCSHQQVRTCLNGQHRRLCRGVVSGNTFHSQTIGHNDALKP